MADGIGTFATALEQGMCSAGQKANEHLKSTIHYWVPVVQKEGTKEILQERMALFSNGWYRLWGVSSFLTSCT